MKKGILYCLFKVRDDNSGLGLTNCIKELNLSVESSSYHDYPKCLIISDSIGDQHRNLIDLHRFDHIIEFKQRFYSLADKLLAFYHSPFDKNLLVDSDIIFLNPKSYDILTFSDNVILEIPRFDLTHLFEQTFALCADDWFFKKPIKVNNKLIYSYNPLAFEFLYQKYNHRNNVFTYNNSVMVFDKTNSDIIKLFDESLQNAEYLCNIRDNSKIKVKPCDQVCLDFAIHNNKIFPSFIHNTFNGGITVKEEQCILHRPLIMSHSCDAMKYMIEKNSKIF